MTIAIELSTALGLREAIKHTNEVIQRPGVQQHALTAKQRVGLFITSLRHSLRVNNVFNLTRRCLWEDVGVLHKGATVLEQTLLDYAQSDTPEHTEVLLAENRQLLKDLVNNQGILNLHHEEIRRNNLKLECIGGKVASIVERSLSDGSCQDADSNRPASITVGDHGLAGS